MKWADEVREICNRAVEYGVDPYFVAAIRRAENGRSGREFGVVSVEAKTYDAQLCVTCRSVRNAIFRFGANGLFTAADGLGKHTRAAYSQAFIAEFGRRWAPIGAENDPNGLNRHWVDNVTKLYYKFCKTGLWG